MDDGGARARDAGWWRRPSGDRPACGEHVRDHAHDPLLDLTYYDYWILFWTGMVYPVDLPGMSYPEVVRRCMIVPLPVTPPLSTVSTVISVTRHDATLLLTIVTTCHILVTSRETTASRVAAFGHSGQRARCGAPRTAR
jgi:hypothetical protein